MELQLMQSHHLVVAAVTQVAVLVAQKAVLHQVAVNHLEVQVLANHPVAVQVQKIVATHHQVQLNQVVLVVQAIVVSHQAQVVVVKHLVHQAAVHLNQAQEQLAHQVKILMVQFLIVMHLVL
ncbi:hypothetical protein CBU03nite_26360 [Clostridium butyricum]|nr:hypothetical protein Cbu04g_14520 [Clostridium butyricum]GEQ26213.1 hypothetical protein CBU03nite_26360 [Clostridium butyricum]